MIHRGYHTQAVENLFDTTLDVKEVHVTCGLAPVLRRSNTCPCESNRACLACSCETRCNLEQFYVMTFPAVIMSDRTDEPGQERWAKHRELLRQWVANCHQLVGVANEGRRFLVFDKRECYGLGKTISPSDLTDESVALDSRISRFV